jgi:hypothetical protein
LPSTSGGIWEFFDAVPPKALTQTLGQGSLTRLYDQWHGVVCTILPQAGKAGQWRRVMGDHLRDWNKYKLSHEIEDVGAAFNKWADLNLDPDRAVQAKTLFLQMNNDIVNRALVAALDQDNEDPDFGPKFTKTIDDLNDAVAHGKAYQIAFDSAQASSDVSHTWAQAQASGLYDFFSGSGKGGYDQLSSKVQTSHVAVRGQFGKVASFSAVPYRWLKSDALALAYGTKDNTVWPSGQKPDWESTFGPNGSMLRYASELVAFDGIDLTITSDAAYSTDEQQGIRVAAKAGVWPFFSAEASGGYQHDVSFDDKGSLTVKVSGGLGNPAILGVNVRPINALFA